MPISYTIGRKLSHDNSKKISELPARQSITTYQNHTWIPVAQFDSRISSYHNIALNLKSITSYCNTYSYNLIDKLSYDINDELIEIDKLMDITTNDDIAYYINNSEIASTLISYSFTYNTNYIDWQFL